MNRGIIIGYRYRTTFPHLNYLKRFYYWLYDKLICNYRIIIDNHETPFAGSLISYRHKVVERLLPFPAKIESLENPNIEVEVEYYLPCMIQFYFTLISQTGTDILYKVIEGPT